MHLLYNAYYRDIQNDIAIIDADSNISLSYKELFNEIKKIHLEDKKLIFLFCDNSLESVLIYLAALYNKNPIALFDKNLSNDKKKCLCEKYQPDIIYNADIKYNKSKEYLINDNLSLLLSTSGSTGSSKLVRLSNKNIKSNAISIVKILDIKREDINITSLPIHYSYGLSLLNTSLISGSKIILTNDNLLNKSFWDKFRDNKCNTFAGVPYSYSILKKLNIDKLNIPTLKILTQAGGKLNDSDLIYFNEFIKNRNGKFYVMYGQTEATARIAILPYDKLSSKIGCVGKAIFNGKIEIENNQVVYYGDNVMMGYADDYNDLVKGDELNGKLYTGDLGYLDEDNFLKITGRNKRICKIVGFRINLDEIQNFLMKNGNTAIIEKNNIIYVFCV